MSTGSGGGAAQQVAYKKRRPARNRRRRRRDTTADELDGPNAADMYRALTMAAEGYVRFNGFQ